MPSDIAGDFAAARGVAHVDRIFQVKFFGEHGEIICVRVHIVGGPRLGGTAVAAPVVRDDSVAALAEEQHLSVPVVRREWPSMTEHYGLTRAPVFVINLRTIFCRNRWHKYSP